ncbi:MAG: TonB-dependent receptor [Acidobacteria bacterium]|nr:TonB-dependent receptor [Acidobacteriota bacterium]
MRSSFRLLASLAVALLGTLFATPCARAQSTATLTGTLTDPSGAAVAQAEISAERLPAAPGSVLRTSSGTDGRFALTLAPGEYRLRVAHPMFARIEQQITLAAGERRELPLRLELERLAATVVVSAQAEPAPADSTSAPVSIVTRQQIDQRQATSLAALLASMPGFSLGRTGREGGVTSLFLNGGNSNFTKVLVDGTTVNEPGGAVDFSHFTLDNVEKIEVVSGAESALFGSDAMAGVVQIFTHRGTTRRPQLTLLAEGGAFSTARGAATLSGLLGRFDYSASAAYLETAGPGPNDGFLNRTLSGNFGWRFTEANQVRLAVRNNTSDAGIAGQTLIVPPDLEQHNSLHNFSANLSAELATGAHWRHRLAGSQSYSRQLFDNPISDFCFTTAPFFCDFPFTARNQFNRAGLAEQSSYLFRQGAITAGYQYEVENGFLSALGGQHARRNNQAGFLDARWQPWQRLTLSGGLRIEANDSFGTRGVPRVGVAYALRDGQDFWGATRLRFSYGKGIKEPRLDQSFGTDPCFPGNAALRPERSRTINAGVEQRLASDRVRITADYFDNRFRDIVSFTFCLPGGPCPVAPPPGCPFGFGTFFNTDLARARGTNIAVEARPTRWLVVSGSYSYDDSRVLQSPNAFDPAEEPGNRLLRRPVHSGNLIANAGFRHMNWNLAAYFTGRRTDSDFLGLGLTRNPGYARFDLGTSYELRRGVTLFGRVENLFDKQYQDVIGFPALGRDFRVGMKWILGGK